MFHPRSRERARPDRAPAGTPPVATPAVPQPRVRLRQFQEAARQLLQVESLQGPLPETLRNELAELEACLAAASIAMAETQAERTGDDAETMRVRHAAACAAWMSQLERVTRQARTLESLRRQGPPWMELSDRLLAGERFPFAPVKALAERIASDVATISDVAELLAVGAEHRPVLSIVTRPDFALSQLHAWPAARYLAWRLQRGAIPERRMLEAVSAVLFQDVGCLSILPHVHRRSPRSPLVASAWLQQHPVIGAATLSGLLDAPLDVPQAVAGHHERLDGTGLPRRSRGGVLGHVPRLVAVVIRLWELLNETTSPGMAARRLRAEAAAGGWDLDAVGLCCDPIDQGAPLSETTTEPGRTFELHAEQQPLIPKTHTGVRVGEVSLSDLERPDAAHA